MRQIARYLTVRKSFKIKLGMGFVLYLAKGERFRATHVPSLTLLGVDVYQIRVLDHVLSINSRQLDSLVDDGILRELP